MKKVAIVGVEGSGKTVFFAAMGDKYEKPDGNGVFLSPLNWDTYSYYTKAKAMLRNGAWPLATQSGDIVELDWELINKKVHAGGSGEKLARLSFLDFAGEVYRKAFGGDGQVVKNADYAESKAVERLKSHVREADILIVLIDLGKIVNGDERKERTVEMNWLSQAILSFAYEEAHKQSVALVFTQSDMYEETVRQCGGVRGALAKYLPIVNTNYGSRLPVFKVAAVDETVPSDEDPAKFLPAKDFESRGFEDLMSWLVGRLLDERTRFYSRRIVDEPPVKPEKEDAPKSSLVEEGTKSERTHSCCEPLMMWMLFFACAIDLVLSFGWMGVFAAFATFLCVFFMFSWTKNHYGRFAAYLLSICIILLVCFWARIFADENRAEAGAAERRPGN